MLLWLECSILLCSARMTPICLTGLYSFRRNTLPLFTLTAGRETWTFLLRIRNANPSILAFGVYYSVQQLFLNIVMLGRHWIFTQNLRWSSCLDILRTKQGLIMQDAHPVDHESIDRLHFLLSTLSRETSVAP